MIAYGKEGSKDIQRFLARHNDQSQARWIVDHLRAEHPFRGGYTIVKDYVHRQTLRNREIFIPLVHAAGHGAGLLRRSAEGHPR